MRLYIGIWQGFSPIPNRIHNSFKSMAVLRNSELAKQRRPYRLKKPIFFLCRFSIDRKDVILSGNLLNQYPAPRLGNS